MHAQEEESSKPFLEEDEFNSEVRRVSYKCEEETLGSDNWTNAQLKLIPDFAFNKILSSLYEACQAVAVPHQNVLNLNSCLGKTKGGSRTIVKTPML